MRLDVHMTGPNSSGRLRGLLVLALLSALLAGCVSAPTQQGGQSTEASIYFVENRSVDRAVREDFDKALRLLRDEQYEPAIVLLGKVIKGSQNNSAPYINIAMAYEKTGDTKRAEENLKKALEINSNHPVAKNELALLYRKTGKYIEARRLYEALLNQYPEFVPARKNLGVLCELYLADAACALEQYELYSQSFPNDEAVKLWVVGLQQKLGQ